MRVRANRLYPYPVLSEKCDDYKDHTFNADIELSYSDIDGTATFAVHVSYNDNCIKQFVKEGKVGIYLHVECSVTKYREMIELSLDCDGNYTVTLPLASLNDTIQTVCILVAKENITNYANTNFGDFYENEIAEIKKYETVGYTLATDFYINKKTDVAGETPSIFTISKDPNPANKEVSFSDDYDKIIVWLPQDEYDIYWDLKGCGKRLKQAMLILPPLTNALEKMKNGSASESEDKTWYTVLAKKMEDLGYSIGSDKLQSEDAYQLAQKLLGNVMKEAFKEFESAFTLQKKRGS